MPRLNSHLVVGKVSKSFLKANQEKVLDDISFEVEPSKILGIIGKSGAGKSTLLRCLNGLEKPDSGHILFQGQDLTQLSEIKLAKKTVT